MVGSDWLMHPQGFAKSKDPLAAKNLYREMRSERVPFGCPGFFMDKGFAVVLIATFLAETVSNICEFTIKIYQNHAANHSDRPHHHDISLKHPQK